MKVLTSYFYAVRFMKPWQIPVSTAVFDPKWFHAFRKQDYVFIDRNGVVNGLRSEKLHPGKSCEGLCSGRPCASSPDSCLFMSEYRRQLASLGRDGLLESFRTLCSRFRAKLGFENEPELMLLVHEAPDNQCSERAALQDFFGCGEFDWRRAV